MAPHHAFALYAFLELNIVLTEKFTRFCGRTYVFFNLEAIKDRRRENRALDICNTTGLMLRLGFRCYLRAINNFSDDYITQTNFKKAPINKSIEFHSSAEDSLWRKSVNPVFSYDTDYSEVHANTVSYRSKCS